MSRPIKHRGKRKDNGEWIEGNYGYKSIGDKHLIMVETVGAGITPDTLRTVPNNWHSYFTDYEVDPETVGQYTGDENRGYEGDILEWVEPIRGEHGDIEDFEHCRGVVEWDNERSGFIVRCTNGIEWLENLMNITIIGNRWDHPHLLKGDDTDAT